MADKCAVFSGMVPEGVTGLANQLFRLIAQQPRRHRVDKGVSALHIQTEDAFADAFQHQLDLLSRVADGFLRLLALGDLLSEFAWFAAPRGGAR